MTDTAIALLGIWMFAMGFMAAAGLASRENMTYRDWLRAKKRR